MISHRTTRGIYATAVVFAWSCAPTVPGAETGSSPGPVTGSTESTSDLESLYQARMDSARMRFTEADARFMTGMIVHHAQAIVMSRLAPSHGASQSVETLAARIINAQTDEIATMQAWLRDRERPVPEFTIEGLQLMFDGVGGDHNMLMPGMLTPEQLRELDDARGTDFDRLFLTYMIQHHGGAVTMVNELFRMDGAAQGDVVFKLASDIQVDQITEISRMETMLESLDSRPQPRGSDPMERMSR